MNDLLQRNSNAKKNHNGLVQHRLAQNELEVECIKNSQKTDAVVGKQICGSLYKDSLQL